MEMIAHEKYILMSLDRKKLKKNGFRYNRGMSDYDCDFYSLKFPVLQYEIGRASCRERVSHIV